MNIFAFSDHPLDCARLLDSRRVVKMILETAQLLSTAVREVAPEGAKLSPLLYKATHRNHPCALWARETQGNFAWLVQYGVALAVEYRVRYGKQHKSLETILACGKYIGWITPGERTEFVNCTSYPDEPNVRHAYMKQLSDKWFEEYKDEYDTKFGPAGTPGFYMATWPMPGARNAVEHDKSAPGV